MGSITAIALLAAGDARQFTIGHQLAASLGLTPRQHSSGGKDRLLGISMRGDRIEEDGHRVMRATAAELARLIIEPALPIDLAILDPKID